MPIMVATISATTPASVAEQDLVDGSPPSLDAAVVGSTGALTGFPLR